MTDKSLVPSNTAPYYEVKEINIREYIYVILKRKQLVLVLLGLTVVLGAIYTFFDVPLYRSFATINVDTSTYSVIPEVISQKAGFDIFSTTQQEILQSRTLSLRVQKKLNLAPQDIVPPKERSEVEEEWRHRSAEDRQNYVADQLLKMLKLKPIEKTTVFEISFQAPQPELSRNLANAWAQEYVEYSLAAQYANTQKVEQLLGQQIKQLQKDVMDKQQMLQEYATQQQVILLGDSQSINVSKLQDLNRSLSESTSDRIAKEVQYRDLQRHGKEAVPEVRTSPVIARLKQEYGLLEREYSEKSGLYNPDFPVMQSLKRQMDQLQRSINDESNDIFNKVLANSKASYEDAWRKEAGLKREVERVKGEAIYASKEEFNYDRLKSELQDKKGRLEGLLQKQSDASAAAQAKDLKATTIRIIDEAQLPKRAYKPNVLYNLAFSFVLGCLLGVGAVFMIDYFDRSLKSYDDVQRYIQVPFLGMIPKHNVDGEGEGRLRALVRRDSQTTPRENIDLVTLQTPESAQSEAFRTVRAGLLVSFPETPPQSILITSSQPSEGKTYVACNLAIALSQLGKKVILVDADLRNPRVHSVWRLNNETGLSRYLTSDAKASDVIRSSQFNGISIITSGTKTPRPTELLSSKRFDDLLSQLRQDFDHIIIDSPPVIPVSDPLVIASKCNCVVLVVRAGITPREVVQQAKQRLAHFDATLAGAILNGIDPTDPYYYYNYFSKYQQNYENS